MEKLQDGYAGLSPVVLRQAGERASLRPVVSLLGRLRLVLALPEVCTVGL